MFGMLTYETQYEHYMIWTMVLVELPENNKPPFALMLCDISVMLKILLLTIVVEIWGIQLGCLKENLMKLMWSLSIVWVVLFRLKV